MSLFRFRAYWEEDDLIYRDIEVMNNHTLTEFSEAINKSFELDGKHPALFFESNDRWARGRTFSSLVTVNKKGAAELSMSKTPIGALVSTPSQKFVYEYDPVKKWTFLIELIGIVKEGDPNKTYPMCIRKEGIAPAQYGIKGMDRAMETVEGYDSAKEDMDEGFGFDDEEGSTTGGGGEEESFGSDVFADE